MAREVYVQQVRLLVAALPAIARQPVLALKGGTAINLFYRDMPRLSVDIDLVYLPIEERDASLNGIDQALDRIKADLERQLRGAQVRRIAGGGDNDTRLLVRQGNTEIKIETSPVARGTVHAPETRVVTERVEAEFGFAEMPVVAFEDLFAGKLHAALDRQHPRDLYDVQLLYAHEGISDSLFRTFLVYVASSARPTHELLRPNLKPIDLAFAREFEGMTTQRIALDELLATRERLVSDIAARLDGNVRAFLLSLHDASPDFATIGLPEAIRLPAVQWKLQNLKTLKERNPRKHTELRDAIESLFN